MFYQKNRQKVLILDLWGLIEIWRNGKNWLRNLYKYLRTNHFGRKLFIIKFCSNIYAPQKTSDISLSGHCGHCVVLVLRYFKAS
jgi:hypothetical protein